MNTPFLEKATISWLNESLLASTKGFMLRAVRHVHMRKQTRFQDTLYAASYKNGAMCIHVHTITSKNSVSYTHTYTYTPQRKLRPKKKETG